jgi:hypothetical protein
MSSGFRRVGEFGVRGTRESGDKVPNVVLHGWLGRLGWSPEQLAAHRIGLTVSLKTSYHWLRGAGPRKSTPSVVAALPSHVSGEHVSAEDLGWSRGRGNPVLDEGRWGLS